VLAQTLRDKPGILRVTAGQQTKLTASDSADGDTAGYSVTLSGSTALVGATNKNKYTGAACVFVRSVTIWKQQAEFTAADGTPGDRLGYSVALMLLVLVCWCARRTRCSSSRRSGQASSSPKKVPITINASGASRSPHESMTADSGWRGS
jgi:hypothetical protein